MIEIKRLTASAPNFWIELDNLLAWEVAADENTFNTVREIIANVRLTGDNALLTYTQQFDRRQLQRIDDIIISEDRLQQALSRIDKTQRRALEDAAARIRDYHQRQVQNSWQYTEADGTILGQQVTPLDRVGLYVPGGKATYPSSVLMNAIPAKVAGVETIIMVVPAPDNLLNDMVLAAAAIVGIDKVFSIGGAQAVAALAYGTATVPRVDKIVGPGNIYVATAKSLVFGAVGIDMIAGPSEILVICDGDTDPDWIAMDLFSQAEHDEHARAMLISPNAEFLNTVQNSINQLITQMPRAEIIRTSLTTRGLFIHVNDLEEAIQVANFVAPEHLELSVSDPQTWASKIRNAGAIFMGRYTAEAIGDYCAGPNHVLPTSRTARFSSPLGVYDFQKRSSLIGCSESGANHLGQIASVLAHSEGLIAHARSAEYRIVQNFLEKIE
jgi:histidinol dehydrogenase